MSIADEFPMRETKKKKKNTIFFSSIVVLFHSPLQISYLDDLAKGDRCQREGEKKARENPDYPLCEERDFFVNLSSMLD